MERGPAPYVNKQDFERVLAAQRGKNALRDRSILYFSHYMALRAKELASLRICDVYDPVSGPVRVVRLLATMTKGGKPREVFLVNPQVIAALLCYLDTRSVRRPEAPLFMSQKGSFFSANTMQRMLGNLYDKAHVNASSHSGRRSCATNLMRAGVDIYTVKTMLGHSSIETTQRYFSTDPERLMQAAMSI